MAAPRFWSGPRLRVAGQNEPRSARHRQSCWSRGWTEYPCPHRWSAGSLRGTRPRSWFRAPAIGWSPFSPASRKDARAGALACSRPGTLHGLGPVRRRGEPRRRGAGRPSGRRYPGDSRGNFGRGRPRPACRLRADEPDPLATRLRRSAGCGSGVEHRRADALVCRSIHRSASLRCSGEHSTQHDAQR